jgi:hypothetical protein
MKASAMCSLSVNARGRVTREMTHVARQGDFALEVEDVSNVEPAVDDGPPRFEQSGVRWVGE